jgi:hypothetical protein
MRTVAAPRLAPHMGLPIEDGWFDTSYFPERTSKAPSSRAQDLAGLAARVAAWSRSKSIF